MNDALRTLAQLLAPELRSAHAQQYGLKHDASGTPIAVGYSHGPGGNLAFPGVDPAVFHTIVGNKGILGQLPTTPSVDTNPLFQVITGVQDVTGSEKDTVCENAPTAGLIKSCMLTSPFGRYERATPELEINRLGQRINRGDPMDLSMIGSPIHQSGIFASGPESPASPADLLVNEISRKFWERNVAIHRLISQQLWIGNPVNNSAGGGYREVTGFDQLINTGHVDAVTNTSCPSINSDLKDFACADVASNGTALVRALSTMYHYVKDLADRTGVMPVRWVIAMRQTLFWELTAIWPCAYLTYRCQMTAAAGQQVVVTGDEQTRMRDDMRTGRYLLIDGERIEVVLDDGIAEDTATTNSSVGEGCFCSDIYLIPMSVVGGRAVTFMEYFDYGNPSLQDALNNMVLMRQEGAFLTWPRQTNQCIVWQTKFEPRLLMRTPWLAGRLQNVGYCPLQHEREPFPDDPYFVDGGLTSRPGPSFYTPWANRG